jgi:cytochrome c oxidase subunit 4
MQPPTIENHANRSDSVKLYLLVYGLLMFLLIATVIAAAFDLGRFNAVIALVIAAIKAILVILFFMHVRHSSRITWIFVAAAFLWLGLLVGLTMTDYASRPASVSPMPNDGAIALGTDDNTIAHPK